MKKEEIISETNRIIKNFINCLDLDGNYYLSVTYSPIVFTNPNGDFGKFLNAKSQELKNWMNNNGIEGKERGLYWENGLIIIEKNIINPDIEDLFVTIIHEKIHSNRMLLLNSQYCRVDYIHGAFSVGDHYVKGNNSKYSYYADAGEDILLGSIDTSRKEVEKYISMSSKKRKKISEADDMYRKKMKSQEHLDEALVELMSRVAYKLYKKATTDVMAIIKEVKNESFSVDIKAIANIILRHNDLELFWWMLDPLSYQLDDVNYDFFSHYVMEEDKKDIDVRFNFSELEIDSDELDKIIIKERSRRAR